VLNGFVDHSDSHGASGRYGNGDVQWMTAGAGLQHAEMFPLLNRNEDNPLELFQIWLNLPKSRKFADPHYKMLWAEDIPVYTQKDGKGNVSEITLIAGTIEDVSAPAPAPDSYAADAENDVSICLIKMAPHASLELPTASAEADRSLYYYRGSGIKAAGIDIKPYHSIDLLADEKVILENGYDEAFLLLLQGKPINEPVVQHGPFVMNTGAEIKQAIMDYQQTQFGGWPWPRHDNVHNRDEGRFAKYADGKEERP